MTEQTFYIQTGPGNILNLDADDQGNFIAFTDDNTVITHDHRLIMDIDVRHPIIRRLNSNTFLLADARTGSRVNAHMYDFGGQRLKSFLAGDAIADIIIQHNKIVITYFDEGVLVGDGPSEEGLAVFDLEGDWSLALIQMRTIWSLPTVIVFANTAQAGFCFTPIWI